MRGARDTQGVPSEGVQGFLEKGFSLEWRMSAWTRKGTELDVNKINNNIYNDLNHFY
jgi:hypothetical protein